jgi:hypothetical protein
VGTPHVLQQYYAVLQQYLEREKTLALPTYYSSTSPYYNNF